MVFLIFVTPPVVLFPDILVSRLGAQLGRMLKHCGRELVFPRGLIKGSFDVVKERLPSDHRADVIVHLGGLMGAKAL